MRNLSFGVLPVLVMLLALVGLLFAGTKAPALCEEVESQEELGVLAGFNDPVCLVFQRLDGLRTGKEIEEIKRLDAEIVEPTTPGVWNIRCLTAEHGPQWPGGGGAGIHYRGRLPAPA